MSNLTNDNGGPFGSQPTDVPGTILVNASITPAIIATLLRYAIVAAASILTALGYTGLAGKVSELLQSIGPISMLIAAGWGVYLTWRNERQKLLMEAHVPDSIARTK